MGLKTAFKLAQYPDIENELLRIDEVLLKFEGSRHDHLFRRWSLSVCENIVIAWVIPCEINATKKIANLRFC